MDVRKQLEVIEAGAADLRAAIGTYDEQMRLGLSCPAVAGPALDAFSKKISTGILESHNRLVRDSEEQ